MPPPKNRRAPVKNGRDVTLQRFLHAMYALRILVTLSPQHGYIHPDEYFQFTEGVAGNVFGTQVFTPWEFKTDQPLRSVFFPHIISAPVFYLMKWLLTDPSPYLLLVAPRLIMTLISFIADWSLGSICSEIGGHKLEAQIVFASSYVALTYMTHTFTNSLEVVLLSLLLLMCIRVHESKEQSMMSGIMGQTGIILALGLFNRPTFACFALIPMMWMVFNTTQPDKSSAGSALPRAKRGRALKNVVTVQPSRPALNKMIWRLKTAADRGLMVLLSFTLVSLILVILDTVYYNREFRSGLLTASRRVVLKSFVSNAVITPLNFLLYNIKKENLANHGLHPPYFHAVVNFPLVFGMISIFFYWDILKWIWCTFKKEDFMNPISRGLLLTTVTSLILLSLIPHQEPRFLIPCLIPLSMVYLIYTDFSRHVAGIHMAFNIMLFIFYAYIHQAGVTKSIFSLNDILRHDSPSVVFSNIYLPPQHLLSVKSHSIPIHDLSQDPFPDSIFDYLQNFNGSTAQTSLLLVIPSSFRNKIETIISTTGGLKMELRETFFPHFSAETLPESIDVILTHKNWYTLYDAFSLSLLNIYKEP